MQHRAAFARAMVTRPSLLLMDEPFGALDAITRLRMHEFLLRMWEQYRITIIFVTHDIEEAVLLGDRVAVMGGRPPGIREVIDVPLAPAPARGRRRHRGVPRGQAPDPRVPDGMSRARSPAADASDRPAVGQPFR